MATLTYMGAEQEVRLGVETFRRNRATLCDDAATIKAAKESGEFRVEGHDPANADAVHAEATAQPAPEAEAAPAPKPKAAKKK